MDDAEHVCPLCCEELDISDREFYPCKCGYQVCMWCWHRIRESEAGLCPACRTPYGEDPHQFSAVDVEEVLKANKEREAALKRQKQEQQQQQQQYVSSSSTSSSSHFDGAAASHHYEAEHGGGAGGGVSSSSSAALLGRAMEVPKDRSQLANIRVIRRNLIYAVGLPPHLATEETLRKPEYFGQYGKIVKIVLNRAAVAGAEVGRRASASAYVTFLYKQDTLACILALDGFYLENRNIRASYGTSKYCSAFIKNVRCNNPECTYLHEMGAAEDTFTKQEIQAGYVTSGRDVLARQQQIVAEQLRQGSAGSSGLAPRKRIGGGGPSGTGRACANPVFPAPEYDEPSKPAPALVPPPLGVTRAVTQSANVSSVLNPANISAKMGRSNSMGGRSPTLGAIAAVTTTQATTTTRNKSAASIVAGVHSAKTDADAASTNTTGSTTLTPLTPLKRVAKTTSRAAPEVSEFVNAKLAPPAIPRIAKLKSANGALRLSSSFGSDVSIGSATAPNNSNNIMLAPAATTSNHHMSLTTTTPGLVSSIGGDVIGGPSLPPAGHHLVPPLSAHSSALGGEVFTGPLPNKSSSTIGRDDKWNSGVVGGAPIPTGLFGTSSSSMSNSSSALASILGVNLPTGSGSLRESSNLWSPGPSPLSAIHSPAAGIIGSAPLNSNNNNSNSNYHPHSGSSLIGGVPIGGGGAGSSGLGAASSSSGPIGSGGGYSGGSRSDIALLQSLLPGVHITSGNDGLSGGGSSSHHGSTNMTTTTTSGGFWNHHVPAGPGGLGGDTLPGWGSSAHHVVHSIHHHHHAVVAPRSSSAAIGAIGQSNGAGGGVPNHPRQTGPGIW